MMNFITIKILIVENAMSCSGIMGYKHCHGTGSAEWNERRSLLIESCQQLLVYTYSYKVVSVNSVVVTLYSPANTSTVRWGGGGWVGGWVMGVVGNGGVGGHL